MCSSLSALRAATSAAKPNADLPVLLRHKNPLQPGGPGRTRVERDGLEAPAPRQPFLPEPGLAAWRWLSCARHRGKQRRKTRAAGRCQVLGYQPQGFRIGQKPAVKTKRSCVREGLTLRLH